jgi:hypothetical protein
VIPLPLPLPLSHGVRVVVGGLSNVVHKQADAEQRQLQTGAVDGTEAQGGARHQRPLELEKFIIIIWFARTGTKKEAQEIDRSNRLRGVQSAPAVQTLIRVQGHGGTVGRSMSGPPGSIKTSCVLRPWYLTYAGDRRPWKRAARPDGR